jgi:hypothetical protein
MKNENGLSGFTALETSAIKLNEGFTPLFSGDSPIYGFSGHNRLTYTRNTKEGRRNSFIKPYYKALDAIRVKL